MSELSAVRRSLEGQLWKLIDEDIHELVMKGDIRSLRNKFPDDYWYVVFYHIQLCKPTPQSIRLWNNLLLERPNLAQVYNCTVEYMDVKYSQGRELRNDTIHIDDIDVFTRARSSLSKHDFTVSDDFANNPIFIIWAIEEGLVEYIPYTNVGLGMLIGYLRNSESEQSERGSGQYVTYISTIFMLEDNLDISNDDLDFLHKVYPDIKRLSVDDQSLKMWAYMVGIGEIYGMLNLKDDLGTYVDDGDIVGGKVESKMSTILRRRVRDARMNPDVHCASIRSINEESIRHDVKKFQLMFGSDREVTVGNTENINFENYHDYPPEDILYYCDERGKIWVFTRSEISALIQSPLNFYNQEPIPLDLVSQIVIMDQFSGKTNLPDCMTVRDFLDIIGPLLPLEDLMIKDSGESEDEDKPEPRNMTERVNSMIESANQIVKAKFNSYTPALNREHSVNNLTMFSSISEMNDYVDWLVKTDISRHVTKDIAASGSFMSFCYRVIRYRTLIDRGKDLPSIPNVELYESIYNMYKNLPNPSHEFSSFIGSMDKQLLEIVGEEKLLIFLYSVVRLVFDYTTQQNIKSRREGKRRAKSSKEYIPRFSPVQNSRSILEPRTSNMFAMSGNIINNRSVNTMATASIPGLIDESRGVNYSFPFANTRPAGVETPPYTSPFGIQLPTAASSSGPFTPSSTPFTPNGTQFGDGSYSF